MEKSEGGPSGHAREVIAPPADGLTAIRLILDRWQRIADAHAYRVAQSCFAAAWLVLSWPWLSGRVTIPYDAKAHFQAQLQFLANALHSGQSPFWNPSAFVGTPHIADPQSLIFTPAFLIAFFDPDPALWKLDAFALGLLLAAGLAAIALARDRGWHPSCAVLAAMVMAFGGPAAWRIQHIGQIQNYAFFIVALWALHRALDRSSKAWAVVCGIFVGAILASPNQVSLLAVYATAGCVIGHWLLADRPRDAFKRSFVPLICAATTAFVLAAVPLLLVVMYGTSSNRPVIAFAEIVRGSLHPASLVTAIVGDLFGALDPKVDYWGPYSERWDPNELTLSQNMSQLYIGALPIVLLATAGLWRGLVWQRSVRPLAVISVVLLLYALGGFTPMFKIMHDLVPGVAQFRRPVDATFLLCGIMGLLSAHVLHRLLTGPPAGIPGIRDMAMRATPAILLAGAMAIAVHEGAVAMAWLPIVKAALWVSVATGIAYGLRGRATSNPALATLVVAGLLTADLAANNGPNESTALQPGLYDMLSPAGRNPTMLILKEHAERAVGTDRRDRIEVVGIGFSWQNAAMGHGLEQTLGYNPLRMSIVADAVGAGDYIAGPDQRIFSPLFPSYRSTLADMLGLRFIACAVPLEQVDKHLAPDALPLIAATSQAFIYQNPNALPRVMFVAGAMPADFSYLVKSGAWPAFDPARTVLLDRGDPIWRSLRTSQAASSEPAPAVIRRYENTRVDVEVTAPQAGFLVLNDLWHPWWEATVDGQPAGILKANVMFRAVRLTSGHHKIRFDFSPVKGALAEVAGRLAAWFDQGGRLRGGR